MRKVGVVLMAVTVCGMFLMTLVLVSVKASSGQTMIKPVTGTVTQEFSESHSGIDIGAPQGTSIYAPSDGTVEDTGWGDLGEGNYIVISHIPGDSNEYRQYCPDENWTKYYHLDSIEVEEEDEVTQGQLIGKVGDTGNATGYHLHFEIRENGRYGTARNPREYIRFGDGDDIW